MALSIKATLSKCNQRLEFSRGKLILCTMQLICSAISIARAFLCINLFSILFWLILWTDDCSAQCLYCILMGNLYVRRLLWCGKGLRLLVTSFPYPPFIFLRDVRVLPCHSSINQLGTVFSRARCLDGWVGGVAHRSRLNRRSVAVPSIPGQDHALGSRENCNMRTWNNLSYFSRSLLP